MAYGHTTRIVAGFLAGALAVIVFHQGAVVIMQNMGMPMRGSPWRTDAVQLWPEFFRLFRLPPVTVPRIAQQAIWGGLFGILFAYLYHRMPGGISLLRGFVFGMIFPMLLGSWLIVAQIKGEPLMAGAFAKGGFNLMALRTGFLLNGVAFGFGLGLLYPLLARRVARN